MPFPILPQIAKGRSNTLIFNESGIWKTDSNSDFLGRLVNSLSEGETLDDVGNIDSIPDIWAKPLLFKMALFDINDTKEFVKGLHDFVTGEWRALLAMFALKEMRHLNLTIEHIDLEYDPNPLAKVFKSLAPQESIDGSKDAWVKGIYVISFNEKPIAIISPVTLVAPSADYTEIFHGTLTPPWSKDKQTLTDPIDMLMEDDLIALSKWLKNLNEELKNLATSTQNYKNRNLINNLSGCVDNYIFDVDYKIKGKNDANFSLIDSDLNLNQGIAWLLKKTVKGEIAVADAPSAVKLIIAPERHKKDLLLISPEMVRDFAKQERVSPEHLVIWPGISALDITEDSLKSVSTQIGKVQLDDVEFRRPEDFFHEKIVLIDSGGGVFPNSLDFSGMKIVAEEDGEKIELTPILPIKLELLELFSPEEIQKRISLSYDSRKITATLTFDFPLSGTKNKQTYFRYKKVYETKDIEYNSSATPVIELWPNISSELWNTYYLLYVNHRASDKKLADNAYYVMPWAYDKNLCTENAQDLMKNLFTVKLEGLPEALIITCVSGGNIYEAGFVLLKKPEPVESYANISWKIGVDFGTSSTMLYFAENDGTAQPLVLDSHLFQITDSRAARTAIFRYFIPPTIASQQDGSFLSIFRLLNPNAKQNIRPLQDGNVYRLSSENQYYFQQDAANIDANLKWQSDPVGRKKTAAYIKQICSQAFVEAVAHHASNVEWNFSYPTAFSTQQKSDFDMICRQAAAEAESKTVQTMEIETYSESEASAYYFNRLHTSGTSNANFTRGAICVDIGAGTTDISIISGQPGRIIFHTSIQYAGKYMFKPIYDNFQEFTDSYEQISKVQNPEKRQALIDADMRENSEKYIQDLAINNANGNIPKILQQSQFAVAGLFYYLGKILRILHDPKVGRSYYKENTLPRIFVGGNGSRIFHWLTGGNPIQDNRGKIHPYLKVLEKMLVEASGLESKLFRINLSSQPKVEVASGMISTLPTNANTFFDEDKIEEDLAEIFGERFSLNSLFAGAEFSKGEESFSAEDFITAQDISEGINITSLDEFSNFVRKFNEFKKGLWSNGISFDEDMAEEIIYQAEGSYVENKDCAPDEIFVEPVFIAELKNFMEMFRND